MLRIEDSNVMRWALDMEFEGQGRKGGRRGHGKSRMKKKV